MKTDHFIKKCTRH
uniref:Uncharacterized protein n=1 Tax=Arundo donax TaxID=35708 RepID=A0A0A8Y077_ARUDO